VSINETFTLQIGHKNIALFRQELPEKKHCEKLRTNRQNDKPTERLTIRVAKAECSRTNNKLLSNAVKMPQNKTE